MNSAACMDTITAYTGLVEGQFSVVDSDDGCFLVTPFERPDGDFIELQVEPLAGDRVRLSDMGDSLGYLYVNGLTLSKAVMQEAQRISASFGVSLDRGTVWYEGEQQSAGEGMHRLIQATQAVSSLIQKRRPHSRVLFDDDVESLLIHSSVPYDRNFAARGERQTHTIRFHLDSGRNLLVQPIAAAQKSTAHSWAERWAYRFADLRASDDRWRFAAVLDDRGARTQIWTADTVTPIQEHAIRWSERDKLEELISG